MYVYENDTVINGVPADITKVRSFIPLGKEQTRQAVYTVPEFLEDGRQIVQMDLTQYAISLSRTQSVSGEGSLVIRELGKVPRERHSLSLSDSKQSVKLFGENTPLVVNPGSDVYLNVENVTNQNTAVFGGFTGSLIPL